MVGASFIRSPADDWQTGLSIFASSVVNQGITTEWGTVERMRGGADALGITVQVIGLNVFLDLQLI